MMPCLSQQFAIATNPALLPANWPQRQLSQFHLAVADDLPCIEVRYPNQQLVALLLGWPVTQSADLLTAQNAWVVQQNVTGQDFENILYQLGGRWICLTTTDNGRLYLDPMASQPCIACPAAGLLLSSAALLPEPWKSNLDQDLMRLMDVENSENFYLFSVLPQQDCYRVLANHYVDLSSFEQMRHWPTEQDQQHHSLPQRAEIIGHVVQDHIKALHHMLPTKIGLSAGYETRLMLACAKPFLTKIQFWTRIEKKYQSTIDQQVAKLLATRFNLNHEFIQSPSKLKEPITVRDWLDFTGHCIGGSALRNRALIDRHSGSHFALTGLGGEVCRAFYRPQPEASSKLTPEGLAILAGVPFHPQFSAAGDKYLAALPALPIWQQLALFYLEIRVGAYASPHKYGNQHGIIFIYPLNHRDAVRAMLTLPLEQQYQNALHRAVIRQWWPELMNVPYNESLNPLQRYCFRIWKAAKKNIKRIYQRK
jgi:hypothetical protein